MAKYNLTDTIIPQVALRTQFVMEMVVCGKKDWTPTEMMVLTAEITMTGMSK
jgi:hypothetical protein